jgi:hypothetical protein
VTLRLVQEFEVEEDDEGVFRVVGLDDDCYILFEQKELGRFLTELVSEARRPADEADD